MVQYVQCAGCLGFQECVMASACLWCDPWERKRITLRDFCSQRCMNEWFSNESNHHNCYRNRPEEFEAESLKREPRPEIKELSALEGDKDVA